MEEGSTLPRKPLTESNLSQSNQEASTASTAPSKRPLDTSNTDNVKKTKT